MFTKGLRGRTRAREATVSEASGGRTPLAGARGGTGRADRDRRAPAPRGDAPGWARTRRRRTCVEPPSTVVLSAGRRVSRHEYCLESYALPIRHYRNCVIRKALPMCR